MTVLVITGLIISGFSVWACIFGAIIDPEHSFKVQWIPVSDKKSKKVITDERVKLTDEQKRRRHLPLLFLSFINVIIFCILVAREFI